MKVTFVSLGPGDPELITVKGLRALREADVVFCPVVGASSRAAEILTALGVERVEFFELPMSLDRAAALEAYTAAARRVEDACEAGKKVAVAAEGDAGFYSSIHYISDRLRVPAERIPGVPAFLACGALAGLHVARGDEALEVLPGAMEAERRTTVVMKPSRCEAEVKQAIAEGAEAHYFENVGVAGREFHTADPATILARTFPYFSLLILRR